MKNPLTLYLSAFGAFVSVAFVCSSAMACSAGYYEKCLLGACICIPNSRTIVETPGELPGQVIEKVREDPVKIMVNPTGFINRTGIPTEGDIFEFVVRSPDKIIELVQNPGQWPYLPIAAGMISGRNAVVSGGGQRIPRHILSQLRQWYPDDLLNSVRWTSNWGPIQNSFQAAQMSFNSSTQAITLINAVVFRNGAGANDPVLWAHEVYHVQQYREWGVFGFAKRWVDNSSDNGLVERPAYVREDEAREIFAGIPATRGALSPDPRIGLPSGVGMKVCGCWGPNPMPRVPEARCASGQVRVNVCPGMCGPGHPAYSYVCF